MSKVSERQVKTDYTGGNFPTLKDFLDQKKVRKMPWATARQVAVSSANFVLINSSMISGVIAKGSTTTQVNGSVIAGALSGAVGTASASVTVADAQGRIANLVQVRKATSNDPLLDSNGRVVYALVQCASTVTDGDSIGGSGSENLQLSFVVYDSSQALALTTINETIQFGIKKVYAARNEGAFVDEDPITPETEIEAASVSTTLIRTYKVTTAFVANEVITVSTGAGATAGVTTVIGDTVSSLGASAAAMASNQKLQLERNGVPQDKSVSGGEVVWDSATTFHFTEALDVGEQFNILIYP